MIPKLTVTGRKFQFNIAASEYLRSGYVTVHQAKDFVAFRLSNPKALHAYRTPRRSKRNFTKTCVIPYSILESGIVIGTYSGRWNEELRQLEFRVRLARRESVDSDLELAYS